MAIDGIDLRQTRRDLENALTDALGRGPGDPAAIKLAARLGAVVAEIGNRHEARRHFRRVVECGPAALGAGHPLVRQAQAYLATGGHAPAGALPTPVVEGPMVEGPAVKPRAGGRLATAVIVGSVAVTIVAAAGVAIWGHHGTVATAPRATRAPAAPTHVLAKASNGTVTVTWQDPAKGAVPFILSGGVAGQRSDIRQQVAAGQSGVVVHGLNASRDYCFTVAAVYGADLVAISDLACTTH